MNVFEFLGLEEEHRKLSNKVTQLVKHWDEVPESRKGGNFVVQVKRDGVCALVVVREDKEIEIFSRTGNLFTNTSVIVNFAKTYHGLKAGVYMAELWVPKSMASLEEFSGMVNPNRVKPLDKDRATIASMARLSMFDYLSLDDFTEGRSDESYFVRHQNLKHNVGPTNPEFIEVLPYEYVPDEAAIEFNLQDQIKKGEEGIVIREVDAGWVAGHKGWRVMKKVRGVDYDLECVGWEEGEGKYEGKIANLIFNWKDGKTIKAMLGKGWTHIDAQQMFQNTAKLKGTIFQVYALEESSKGKLRLPKVGELRHDKVESDLCTKNLKS